MPKVDKAAVRADYARGFSLRQLAAKYDVPKSTIDRWLKQNTPQPKKTPAVVQVTEKRDSKSGTVERDSGTVPKGSAAAEDYAAMRKNALIAMERVGSKLEEPDLNARDLRALCSALLDVRTMLNILTPREAAEQELRLIALRKQIGAGEQEREPVKVVFVNREWTDADA